MNDRYCGNIIIDQKEREFINSNDIIFGMDIWVYIVIGIALTFLFAAHYYGR